MRANDSSWQFGSKSPRSSVAEQTIWPTTRLGDVIELKRGYDLPTASREPGIYPVVSSSGITGKHSAFRARPPGVVTGRYGTIGQVFYLESEFWPLNTTLYVRDFKGNDPRFVSYFLRTLDFLQFSDKAAIPGVNRNHVHEAFVRFPPIKEQRAIASVLGALDDKIELNRRMNETLEALARAIFTSWFGNFDPVHARAEGRQPIGMNAETAALFPDSFEDSPLGPIPSGWHAGELGDVVSMNIRSRQPEHPYREIKYVDIASVTRGRLEAAAPMPLDAAPSRARRLVTDGDVIWSCVRPNRRSYLRIDHPPDNLVVSTGFVVLTPTAVPSSYLYLSVTTDEFVDYLTANADGSAYPAVRPEHFDRSPMLIPEKPPLRAFDDRVLPMLRRMAANERENNTLAVIRDSLLPKLVSGDIRIGPGAHPEGSGDKFHAAGIIG